MKVIFQKVARTRLLSFLLLLISVEVNAAHLTGAEISYTCLGGCTYRVTHIQYFDCSSGSTFLPPNVPTIPYVTFQGSPAGCNQVPLLLNPISLRHYVEVTPICPGSVTKCSQSASPVNGILEAVHDADYDMCFPASSPCNKYTLGWGSCCRNGLITSGAANAGFYLKGITIDLSLSPCNSSPQFLFEPPMYICSGQSQSYSQRAYDPDGDSLAYKLISCKTNVSGTPVTYAGGYSPQQPLGPIWAVNLDVVTGELSFVPNPTGGLVSCVICVEVEEWRNGVKIGTIVRDMMATVVANCGAGNTLPQVDSVTWIQGGQELAPSYFNMCQLDTLEVLVHASDPDSLQSLIMKTSSVIPGVTVFNNSVSPATAILRFVPPAFGEYDIPIKVLDDHCLIVGEEVAYIHVSVGGTCLTANVTGTACGQSNGAIDLMVSNGFTPFTYLWSNGDTTEDLTGLSTGNYIVTLTDSLGNTFADSFFVNGTNIALNPTITQPTCSNRLGSISLAPTGGSSPYTYAWSSGQTTSALNNQAPGTYQVTFSDLNGCSRQEDFVLHPADSCFNLLSGIAYNDGNGNCIQDTNETGIPNAIIDLTPGGAVLTDSNGRYSFMVDTGSFDVEIYPPKWKSSICPTNRIHAVTFTNWKNVPVLDFAMETDSVIDLAMTYTTFPISIGRLGQYFMRVTNQGAYPMTGTLTWEHDSIYDVHMFRPVTGNYNVTNKTITWNFTNLQPSKSMYVNVTTVLRPGVMLGDTFSLTAQVTPIVGDTFPLNNTFVLTGTVGGPYDPNDKQVSPQGIGPLGYIEQAEQQMNYTIRFQNTGTDTAYHVQIRDTIDTQVLDVFSFESKIEIHAYRMQIEEDSILVFDFDNIKLPDSTTNFEASQGLIQFGMKHNGTLAPGSQIRNTAAIYFDTNPPIFTNTVLNTVFAYPAVTMGSDSICAGDSLQATLGATGVPPFAFLWSDGTSDLNNQNGTSQIEINAGGTYQVRVRDAIGNEVLDSLAVTIAPEPNAAFVTLELNINDFSFTDTSAVNTAWYWDFGDGNIDSGGPMKVHSYPPGVYTCILIAENACGRDTFSQMIGPILGIEDDLFVQSIQLFPHPVQDISYLQFNNSTQELYSLRILDLQGRVVQSFPPHRGDQFEIAKGDLARGVYLYELKGKYSFYGKMVVK